ncbi:MAG: hypothetical protein CMJ64_07565 [Planctomycetaceae bacterium]|nr:hypothetical protein [Planctomycetaceae bacterium]
MMQRRKNRRVASRPSFTLVELVIVLAIITILASALLFALFGVAEDAKATRTRAQIAKLHELVMLKHQAYRTRAVRLGIPPSTTNNAATLAAARLLALRDLMRMELPDRITDLASSPVTINVPRQNGSGFHTTRLGPPALWRNYRKRAGFPRWPMPGGAPTWTTDYQGAECLYMIVATLRDGDSSGLDFFEETEIDDVDSDGMSEIVDGWGNPIMFFRWAPGFATTPGPDGGWGVAGTDDDSNGVPDDLFEMGWPGSDDASELQSRDAEASPDPFDALQVDGQNYALIPLIYSAGPDRIYDLSDAVTPPLIYTAPTPPNLPNDPYTPIPAPALLVGRPQSGGGPSDEFNSLDNITNHLIATD